MFASFAMFIFFYTQHGDSNLVALMTVGISLSSFHLPVDFFDFTFLELFPIGGLLRLRLPLVECLSLGDEGDDTNDDADNDLDNDL